MTAVGTPAKLLASVLWIGFFGVASAQTTRERTPPDLMEETGLEMVRSSLSEGQFPGVALESKVDPALYYVGPSDVLVVTVGPPPAPTFTLTVTPEGTLIVPTVGEVPVAEITLAEAKDRILTAIRRRYLAREAFVTLLRPRPVVVMVTGFVLNPGLYTLSAVDRANKAIEAANKPARLQTKEDLEVVALGMSSRNIMLRHRGGGASRVDITRFLATREDIWNPYLREGDVIVVPRRSGTRNVIGVYGEVNAPGRFEFVEGDSLLGALALAHGFTPLARRDSVEFSRLSPDGSRLETAILDLTVLDPTGPVNLRLQPGDRLVVKARREEREDFRVNVQGEVTFPGTYPITRNATRLSDVVRQAGGFTADASLGTAELIRRSLPASEVQLEQLLSLRGGVSVEDSGYYVLETGLRIRKEIVNVDFEALFVNGDSTQDVLLQSDDDIVIPSVRRTVYVFGQVVSPGHIPYLAGNDPSYYVRQAGGFTDRARRGDMRIIKAKTRQWLDPDETRLEAGDYIWVPKDPERDFAYYMMVASQAASVLSVVVGIAVVIVQVSK